MYEVKIEGTTIGYVENKKSLKRKKYRKMWKTIVKKILKVQN